ncbi:DUF6300 family protein [Streptomyces colonosanans]|uniref:Uncharacterized protein n=1 Tax=Streptomyces colonosanans TaxID=1428652 RepID=A0A1S2NVI8_9ACTN|nr:DUF6300 family protein [Streptomyces colonosanans]OIJ85225.1 hypothetical protein BIV24_29100 [Streptomyces colonosanans]
MSIEEPGEDEALLKLEDTPSCPHCGGPTLLLARYPQAWKSARGEDVSGIKEAVLCAACDHVDAAAAELIALFNLDEQVSPEMETFGGLAAAWVESVRQRTVDETLLQEQHELWRCGELDGQGCPPRLWQESVDALALANEQE